MRVALLLIATAAGTAVAAPTRTFVEEVQPGIQHEIWEQTGVVRIHLVRVDLTSQELSVVATKEGDAGITTGTFANRYNLAVAINGNPFQVSNYHPYGFALGAEGQWSNTADDAVTALLHARRGVADNGERNFAVLEPPETVQTRPDLPLDTSVVVSGRPLLLRANGIEPPNCDDPIAIACQAAPRTAIGLSADGKTMFMATVDGWQAGSDGMTAAELAAFLRARGAYMAMALDSGASSTMIINKQLANAPSDTVQRRVANHIGVGYQTLTHGAMAGRICTPDISACTGGDTSGYLPGARVTLDDGRFIKVGSDAFYTFGGITPREACVTVSLTGYKTRRQCVQIQADTAATFNSVALEAGDDPPADAATPDANEEPPVDAPDGNPNGNGDGGILPPPPGGGCCEAGHGHGTPPILFALVVWVLVRRKRHG